MNLTRRVGASLVAGGVAAAGLFGLGLGTANANPDQRCGVPNTPACQGAPVQNNGWQNRNIDAGRQDHQPFNYSGRLVTPMKAGNGDGWGFWFLGQWIRL
ncbi:hypothetical protein JDV09_23855 [Mycobacterium sp. Y57]|uniref:hypothetical protein n=1 Tax=Mycolicibacterium xanthum TaxID=2796469 RepID=UPI001C85804E|nr:hypothetical protein [Mycolicibacterium xanthum]MBX7435110.1 hypothetical protein [Mycolicibacterium xanthum]